MAKHHYVSKLYYKNFAFNPDGSLVYAMDNRGNIINRPKSIRRISFEEDYNTPEQEREQSRFETKYREILREFIETPNPGNSNLSRDFVNFVCFIMGNNPYIRKKLDEGLSNMELQIKDAPSDHYISMPKEHKISMPREHKGKFDWSLAFADAVFEEFHNWKFVRHETNTHKVFITSDNPVSIFNPEDVRIPATANVIWRDPRIVSFGDESIPTSDGWMSRETQVQITLESVSFGQDVVLFFPVSPSICLVGFSDSKTHTRYMEYPKNNVNFPGLINSIIFSRCNKAVYSHSMNFLKGIKADWRNFQNYCNRNGIIPSLDLVLGRRGN